MMIYLLEIRNTIFKIYINILKKTLENILSIIVRIGSNRRESENDWGGWKKENGE